MRILRIFALSLLAIGAWVALAEPAVAQILVTLHTFSGDTDGQNPYTGLVRDAEGNLYGTTAYGGFSNNGTVFKLDTAGKETVLYRFTGGADGAHPFATLIRDADGNLYGTTRDGGNPSCPLLQGCGTVFKLDKTGEKTVLYYFHGTDGADPNAGLIRDAKGNLYGTTFWGGEFGQGTVFKLDGSGQETVLHSFNGPGYSGPLAGLVRDAGGNLYGTTQGGGDFGGGTVFKLDRTGKQTVLHSFNLYGTDGNTPTGNLIRDAAGNLFGTTRSGGAFGFGTVFKLDTTGTHTVLHSFNLNGTDGSDPNAGLIQDAEGALYGTTAQGGGYNRGTLFKLNRNGKLKVLYNFTNGLHGGYPLAGLVRDAQGNLYGTTFGGGVRNGYYGDYGRGTVFKFKITRPN